MKKRLKKMNKWVTRHRVPLLVALVVAVIGIAAVNTFAFGSPNAILNSGDSSKSKPGTSSVNATLNDGKGDPKDNSYGSGTSDREETAIARKQDRQAARAYKAAQKKTAAQEKYVKKLEKLAKKTLKQANKAFSQCDIIDNQSSCIKAANLAKIAKATNDKLQTEKKKLAELRAKQSALNPKKAGKNNVPCAPGYTRDDSGKQSKCVKNGKKQSQGGTAGGGAASSGDGSGGSAGGGGKKSAKKDSDKKQDKKKSEDKKKATQAPTPSPSLSPSAKPAAAATSATAEPSAATTNEQPVSANNSDGAAANTSGASGASGGGSSDVKGAGALPTTGVAAGISLVAVLILASTYYVIRYLRDRKESA